MTTVVAAVLASTIAWYGGMVAGLGPLRQLRGRGSGESDLFVLFGYDVVAVVAASAAAAAMYDVPVVMVVLEVFALGTLRGYTA